MTLTSRATRAPDGLVVAPGEVAAHGAVRGGDRRVLVAGDERRGLVADVVVGRDVARGGGVARGLCV